jgi:hypothetical protein
MGGCHCRMDGMGDAAMSAHDRQRWFLICLRKQLPLAKVCEISNQILMGCEFYHLKDVHPLDAQEIENTFPITPSWLPCPRPS